MNDFAALILFASLLVLLVAFEIANGDDRD